MTLGLIATSSMGLDSLDIERETLYVPTRWGDVLTQRMRVDGDDIYLVRRGSIRHPLEPGLINTRAICAMFAQLDVRTVLSTCVVGSLRRDLQEGTIVSLQQFIDFTSHRPRTIFADDGFRFTDMSEPYCPQVQASLQKAAIEIDVDLETAICYVGVDGPRYETAAEVRIYSLLGGDVVGHTGVAEAIYLRELGICHGALGLVANLAAGLNADSIDNEVIGAFRQEHGEHLEQVALKAIGLLTDIGGDECQCAGAPGALQSPPWIDAR
ncbi:MTAP family purine nucleoside phosphorylase [Kribbella sp. NPDC051587]|uniref:MTAP family purine nucleoside phosphorylase n=1 Tax=Kribbella sp. NPDC051587 TaxID=3364119 RepID=UPI0037A84B49